MQGACRRAPQAIQARQDGRARALAAELLAAAEAADAAEEHGSPEVVLRACRRILLQLTLIKACHRFSIPVASLRKKESTQ